MLAFLSLWERSSISSGVQEQSPFRWRSVCTLCPTSHWFIDVLSSFRKLTLCDMVFKEYSSILSFLFWFYLCCWPPHQAPTRQIRFSCGQINKLFFFFLALGFVSESERSTSFQHCICKVIYFSRILWFYFYKNVYLWFLSRFWYKVCDRDPTFLLCLPLSWLPTCRNAIYENILSSTLLKPCVFGSLLFHQFVPPIMSCSVLNIALSLSNMLYYLVRLVLILPTVNFLQKILY